MINNNFKAVCIKDTTYATKDKVYEFVNSVTIWDNGTESLTWLDVYDFCKGNKAFKPYIERNN